MSTGKKFDQSKPPVTRGVLHYFPRALEEVAMASKVGHTKYSVPYLDKNWMKVEDGEGRYLDGAGRHLLKISSEGALDKESLETFGIEVYHAAQVAWNILAYLELVLAAQNDTPVDDTSPRQLKLSF